MILSFHPCFNTDVQIILGDRAIDADTQSLIRQAEAIILPQGCTRALFDACSDSEALLFPNYEMRFRYPGKMGQSRLFADYECPHPETRCWDTVGQYMETHLKAGSLPHEFPFLIKEDVSHEAAGIFLAEDRKSLLETLDILALREKSGATGFVTQTYIPCDGNTLRSVVMGGRAISYWKRPSTPEQAITTVSKGALIDHTWQPALQEKGRVLSQGLSDKTGINLAAIDMIFPRSDTGSGPVFLEINYFFGRRGLGGSKHFYGLLCKTIHEWLAEAGLDPKGVTLI
jgi:ribosomal protein S6--L-glutamate ligase